MTISPAVLKVLRAGRSHFNARVVEAKHRYPAFDVAAFSAFLLDEFSELSNTLAHIAPDHLPNVTNKLYDLALDLAGHGLIGTHARNTFVNRIWREVAPNYVHLIITQPLEVMSIFINAVFYLQKYSNVNLNAWLHNLQQLAPQVQSREQLRSVAQILAWRTGAAHFRKGVLCLTNAIAPTLARAAFAVPDNIDLQTWYENTLIDPWWMPHNAAPTPAQARKIVGAFSGFGGLFTQTPQVRAWSDGFLVKSGERYSLLIADLYGATFHPAEQTEYDHAVLHIDATTAPVLKGDKLISNETAIELGLPSDGLAVASNKHTIAVTSIYSYAIRLWARA
jgi:hypothetical protein